MGWQDDEVVQSPSKSSWQDDEIVDKGANWSDLPKNIIPNAKDVAKGFAENTGRMVKGYANLPEDVSESTRQLMSGTNPMETPIGKDIKTVGENIKGIPQSFANLGSKKAWIEQPIGNAVTAGSLALMAKGLMGKTPNVNLPKQPIETPIPESPEMVPMRGSPEPVAEPISRMPPDPNAPPVSEPPPPNGQPTPPPESGIVDDLMSKAGDVKNYINKSYESAAKKPGFAPKLADLAQEKSQMMAVKAAGGGPNFAMQGIRAGKTPIQINNELRAIGQYMLDNDIVQPELGNDVMLNKHASLLKASGEKIGAIREIADKLYEPTKTSVDVLQDVQSRLGEQYADGMPGSHEFQTALKIVEQSKPTFSGFAETATKLNKLANKANKNYQAHTPYTDVANVISEINNEHIKSIVGPKLAGEYEQGLREFGVNKKIANMLGRKVGQELRGAGPGSITRNIYQKFMDEVGYKGGAKVMNKMAGNIKNNPAMAKNLPSLFKSFINEVEDILPEREGMAHGGEVKSRDEQISDYLLKEYGSKVTQ